MSPSKWASVLAFASCAAWAQPEPLVLGEQKLVPASCGVRRTLWIEHYAAQLYVPAGNVDTIVDPGQPKALRIRILNSVLMPGDIPGRWHDALEPVLGPGAMAALRATYEALGSGDVVVVMYEPGRGVTLQANGRVVAQHAGHRAIDALLGAWAAEMPPGEKLKRTAVNNPCR